jgi:hypothetical protein
MSIEGYGVFLDSKIDCRSMMVRHGAEVWLGTH